jgi:DNA-binding NarL/FixJ family response regulator
MNHLIKIAIADDHTLVLAGLASILEDNGYKIVVKAANGEELINELKLLSEEDFPEILLIDDNMPVMNGIETVKHVSVMYPTSSIAVMSYTQNQLNIIEMVKFGVKAILSKDSNPKEFLLALQCICNGGTFYTEHVLSSIICAIYDGTISSVPEYTGEKLTEKERIILKKLCTDKSYEEIAADLNLSVKTINNYRESLGQKLNAKSRIGLMVNALKFKLVSLDNLS